MIAVRIESKRYTQRIGKSSNGKSGSDAKNRDKKAGRAASRSSGFSFAGENDIVEGEDFAARLPEQIHDLSDG